MSDSDEDAVKQYQQMKKQESESLRIKILNNEIGNLRKRCIAYADKYDYLGGKTLLQEANKWKHKYQRLLKIHKKADTRKKANLIKENAEISTELSYYKSKFFDLEYKYAQMVRDEIGGKDYKEKMMVRFDKLSTDNINLRNEVLHLKEIMEDSVGNPDSSYGYNSMEACIEDMNSDNPEYPFTEKEKKEVLKKMHQLDKHEEKMKENNEKLEEEVVAEVIEDKEDEYQYVGYTQITEDNIQKSTGAYINTSKEMLLKNKLFKKRIMGSIRKKHKELYKKHKVQVVLETTQIENNKIKYSYTLELKDKKKKIKIEED